MDNRYLDITSQLMKWHMLHRLLSQQVTKNSPIYPGQLPILLYVANHPGCTQQEIATEVKVSCASIAQSIKRLQKSGFLRKEVDGDNLRRNKISITPAGHQAAASCIKHLNQLDERMFHGFSDEEIDVLGNYIRRLLANMAPADWQNYDFIDYMAMFNQLETEDCGLETEEGGQ